MSSATTPVGHAAGAVDLWALPRGFLGTSTATSHAPDAIVLGDVSSPLAGAATIFASGGGWLRDEPEAPHAFATVTEFHKALLRLVAVPTITPHEQDWSSVPRYNWALPYLVLRDQLGGNTNSVMAFSRLEATAGLLAEIISIARGDTKLEEGHALAGRLSALAAAEEGDDNQVRLDSVRGLLTFLRGNARLKRPKLSLAPDGTVVATWRGPANLMVTVQFANAEVARYVCFRNNRLRPERRDRFSGETGISDLLDALKSIGPLDWLRA